MSKQEQKRKNLLGDVFDLLAGNTNFVTPKMFQDRHRDMEVDYDMLQIRINKDYVLQLIPQKKP